MSSIWVTVTDGRLMQIDKEKPAVLIMPEGNILAHVGRALSIANALLKRNVDVSLAASGKHAERLRKLGLPLYPIHTAPRDELLDRLRTGGSAFSYDELSRCVTAEIELLEELQPEIVVGDFRPSLSVSAPYVGIPYVSVTNTVWTPHCRFQLDPPDSWLPTKILGKPLLRRLRPVLERPVFRYYARPFDRLRRSYGLSELRDIRRYMCSEDLTLLADTPDLFPTTELPQGFTEIGPILWEPDAPDPPWLNELANDLQTVYVTMGSTGPAGTLKRIIKKLLDSGFQVTCTTAQEPQLRIQDSRFYSVPYARGSQLCRLADVVVCHGGNGTIYQALSQGTPVVGIPEFHDQEFNMQQIDAMDLGSKVKLGSRTDEQVCEAVHTVLEKPEYRSRAQALKQEISSWNAPEKAADCIIKTVRQGDSSNERRLTPVSGM